MARLEKKHREALAQGLQETRVTMNAWMTIFFRVSMCLGAAALLGVILLYTLAERQTGAWQLATIAGLSFAGAIKLGMDMTRCELQFRSLENAIRAGAIANTTRAIRGIRCFGALEKFSDDLTQYIQRSGEPDGPE
jgi:hypothetical protein